MSTVTLSFEAVRTGHKQIVASWPVGGGTDAVKAVGRLQRHIGKTSWTAVLDCRCGSPIRITGTTLTRTCAAVEHHLRTCGRWWS